MGIFKLNKRLFLVITMLTFLLAGIASFSNSYSSTNAFGACKPVGSFMESQTIKNKTSGIASPDAGNRKWTVEEVFKGSVAFSSFYGEGPGTWYFAEKEKRGEGKPGYTDDTQKSIENSRTFICTAGGMDWVTHTFTLIANGLTWLTGATIMMLIGKDLMAETLTTIVGGGGEGEGLIGTFLSSFYMPLVIIAVVIMAVTLIYKGLIQMKLRESLSSLLWSFGAFVIGVTFMLNPQLLASAPQKATSTITSCVIGALSGQNCLSGDVAAPSVLAGKECVSTVGGKGNDAENVTNSLNCTIWKAFVLEPWAEEQFGAPYNKLYTKDPPANGAVWDNLPKDQANKYCVNLSSSKSYNDSTGSGVPVMDGSNGTVCNVALYHLFVKTKIQDTVNQKDNNYNSKNVIVEDETGSYDSRWYDIIVPMANDDSKWRNWAGNGMFFSRLGTSLMGLIAIIASSTILLTLAAFGGAYKIVGLILMAFAPVFFLFAIEPTRGRRIFLGWLETLVSSILKYFAITVLIVVALVMYAGLLSNTTGVASLVGTIILTLALHMYRKEIVDLIGASNMGGQRLSNKVNEMGSKAGRSFKEKGGALVGGAVGGAWGSNLARNDRINARNSTINDLQRKIASASNEEEEKFYSDELRKEEEAKMTEGTKMGSIAKGSFSGSKDTVARSLKRGSGLSARAFQQSDRTREDLRRQAEKESDSAEKRRAMFQDQSDISKNLENVDIEKTGKEIKRDVAINDIRDSQRENVDYEGKLSGDEIAALDKFANKLANSATDDELAFAATNEAVLNDPNKRNLVANEINARIRANSMVGISSNILSRTNLTDNEFVSDEELEFNVEMHKENFLETGSERELDKFMAAKSELSIRKEEKFDSEATETALREFKKNVGDSYERNIKVPTENELKGKDNYNVKLPNGTELDSREVSTPKTLDEEVKVNGDKVQEAKDLEKAIKKEKLDRVESVKKLDKDSNGKNKLPDLNDVDEANKNNKPLDDKDSGKPKGPKNPKDPDDKGPGPGSDNKNPKDPIDKKPKGPTEREKPVKRNSKDEYFDNESFNLEKRQRPEVDERFSEKPNSKSNKKDIDDLSKDPYESLNKEMEELNSIENSLDTIEDLDLDMQIMKDLFRDDDENNK